VDLDRWAADNSGVQGRCGILLATRTISWLNRGFGYTWVKCGLGIKD
jgi:hypothetical protein